MINDKDSVLTLPPFFDQFHGRSALNNLIGTTPKSLSIPSYLLKSGNKSSLNSLWSWSMEPPQGRHRQCMSAVSGLGLAQVGELILRHEKDLNPSLALSQKDATLSMNLRGPLPMSMAPLLYDTKEKPDEKHPGIMVSLLADGLMPVLFVKRGLLIALKALHSSPMEPNAPMLWDFLHRAFSECHSPEEVFHLAQTSKTHRPCDVLVWDFQNSPVLLRLSKKKLERKHALNLPETPAQAPYDYEIRAQEKGVELISHRSWAGHKNQINLGPGTDFKLQEQARSRADNKHLEEFFSAQIRFFKDLDLPHKLSEIKSYEADVKKSGLFAITK